MYVCMYVSDDILYGGGYLFIFYILYPIMYIILLIISYYRIEPFNMQLIIFIFYNNISILKYPIGIY